MTVFNDRWFGASRQVATRHVVEAVLADDVGGAWIEVGCWEGRSTCFIANLIAPRKLHAVDHWKGSPSDLTGQLATQRDVHAVFAANVADLNVVEHRMDWEQFFGSWTDPIALVHFDAEHRYEAVVAAIAAAQPFIAEGGAIIGNDYDWSDVPRACEDALGTVERDDATWWWRSVREA